MLFRSVPTPCIGICSTTYGDTVCRGCRRYLHEVIEWNRFADSEKRLIWQRLDGLLQQVMPRYFEILDADLLRRELLARRIPLREEASAWTWLQQLLKQMARQVNDLAVFGVRRIDNTGLDLYGLREQLNSELHMLASAYYERDLLRAQQLKSTAKNGAQRGLE
ncbi:MAG: DUF1289 domain-containing protein [Pseudomonadota bacterium]